MAISVFDLFKVGIGPSSSHTVGPMRAARLFALRLQREGLLASVAHVRCELLGSLGATGKGHGSDRAVQLGLMGHEPDSVPIDAIPGWLQAVRDTHRLSMLNEHEVSFDPDHDLVLDGRRSLPFHPNAMTLMALDAKGQALLTETWYSVGGGFVVSQDVAEHPARQADIAPGPNALPLPFHSAGELLALCTQHGLSIADLMRRNETHWRSNQATRDGLQATWQAMHACVRRGCGIDQTHHPELPGGFKVRRRAPQVHQRLTVNANQADPLQQMDWVTLWALAVNEENASGGRVVTAPTNGAAGIVPAVLHHAMHHLPGASDHRMEDFLLTAAAIGLLCKENASISGAEVGCQGEVGVACAMAAAGLCAVMGGTPAQVENAAEIGLEHHLGLTCDPVGGLVQIPCIERNAVGAVQALHAARLALLGDGQHRVSLDQAILTMKQTGADMQSRYKETSLGGLAVNIVAC
ncbi:L-serine ammonia-lyase [Aquabacterium sp. UBA2148]|uniref:L-serine ammonia-lyase n=1 Tax=Aquabacterium sp. UBA2148 TaxID=1946042 RepID=UPI00257EB7E1|nr:L-serine ammonia-lyase [Aquabacterium sp. UBA2148]